jgi:hypothetical protein
MRKNFFVFCFFLAGVFTLHADDIYADGEWKPASLRSSASSATLPPSASVEGDVLSIYFPGALSNLTVTVSSADGNPVCQICISGASGYTYNIPLGASPGEYLLTLTHPFGTLSGYFAIQ